MRSKNIKRFYSNVSLTEKTKSSRWKNKRITFAMACYDSALFIQVVPTCWESNIFDKKWNFIRADCTVWLTA